MLAVVKDRPGPGFTLKEVAVPEPNDDEVLIKVKSVGICGSDIPIFKGIREVNLPLIPGHEFSGVIIRKGRIHAMASAASASPLRSTASTW